MDVERGRLAVIAAPSGAGKTTLVRALLEHEPRLRFSISCTTRRKRPNEVDGRDYVFVDERQFQQMVSEGAFLECARVFDNWYGTRKRDVEALLAQGLSVLLEIDWQGARQVRARVPEALTVFILPPSFAELKRRLHGRGSDSPATIERRLRDAMSDMSHWSEFDYTLFNEDVARSVEQLRDIIAGRGEPYRSDAPSVRARAAALAGSGDRPEGR